MNHNNRLEKAKPIARQDVTSISERVKHMQIISNAEGELLLMRAHQLGNTDRPQAITCLIQAIEKFEVVLNSNPHSKATLRQCGQAIGNLELERSRGKGRGGNAVKPSLDISSATLSRANQYFLRAISLDPHDPLTLLAYAHFLEQCDRPSLAEEYYLQVLENDPNYIEALHDYGQLLEELGASFLFSLLFLPSQLELIVRSILSLSLSLSLPVSLPSLRLLFSLLFSLLFALLLLLVSLLVSPLSLSLSLLFYFSPFSPCVRLSNPRLSLADVAPGEGFYAEKFFMRIAQHHNATLWHQHQQQQKLKGSA